MPTALITGSSRGIGLSIARMLLRRGHDVIVTGTGYETLHKSSHVLSSDFPHRCIQAFVLDYSNLSSVATFRDHLKDRTLDVVIHNAGMLSTQSWTQCSDRRILQMFHANVIGPLLVTKTILPAMLRENKGHILFFSPPYKIDKKVDILGPYMQTKLAQTTLMRSLAHSLRDTAIGVNSFWTAFPIYTDAISHRKIGNKEDCMDSSLIAHVVEKILFEEDPQTWKGNEIIDADYIHNIERFQLGRHVKSLDSLFLDHVTR